MKIRGTLEDKKPLIKALEEETGMTAVYSGIPSFRYQIGPYTILRDGNIEVEDKKADCAVLERLSELGLIEREKKPIGSISFDTTDFTGRTMTNIVNCFAARENLINKAIGIPNAFHMKIELVQQLKKMKPATMTDFMAILHSCGGENAMRGLALSGDRLVFTGFPETDACRMLAERIVHIGKTNRWVKSTMPTVINEKYSLREWISFLGMKGEAYASARAELLKNLTGAAAFRTEEQQKIAYKKYIKKETDSEADFVLL